MIPFTNPYEELPDDRTVRTTIVVSTEHKSHIFAMHGRTGTLQTTINILLNKLIESLKQNGYIEQVGGKCVAGYDPDAYESAVAGATIVLGVGSANSTPNPREAVGGNVGRGVSGLARPAAGFDKPANVAGAPAGGVGKVKDHGRAKKRR